jgi:hypothetical protein
MGEIDAQLGTPIVATAGADIIDVNLVLDNAGAISGTVLGSLSLPAAGIGMDLYDAVTGIHLDGTLSADNGTYQFESLNPGSYKVRAKDTTLQGYALEYHEAQINKKLADVIDVAPLVTTMNVDFDLEFGGTISGNVIDMTSNLAIPIIDIDLFQAGTLVRLEQGAVTDENGNYTIVGIPAGTYVVRADPTADQSYGEFYYGGVANPADATGISLNAGEDVIDIGISVVPTILAPAVPSLTNPALGALGGLMTMAAAFVIRSRGGRQ